MEYIKIKRETAYTSLENLKKGVAKFEQVKNMRSEDEEEYRQHRDSLIKRFELAFDTLWKFAKVYLEIKAGLIQNSPKSVFRELLRINLISESCAKQALQMVDDRNATTHTYREKIAEKISSDIIQYYNILKLIFDALQV